ncbi:MAG: hypothetical protein WC365_03585 [Candidatus Babeliales bacterium]|jgi:hypothetical protein
MKDIIFFTDIGLFNECEIAARQNELVKAQDFIINCCEKFLVKNNYEKIVKKPVDLFLALDINRKNQCPGLPMGAFIEKICRDELHPERLAVEPVITSTPEQSRGFMQKIGDAISLPRS